MTEIHPPFVSTGTLPELDAVTELVEATHRLFASHSDGDVSDVYPVLGDVPPDQFGICVATVGGDLVATGDSDVAFPIMSVVKPFTFALACEALGPDAVRERLGVNATGLPFNSLEAVARDPSGRTNPMVNPGAIATVSLVPGADAGERWLAIHTGLSAFAGRQLAVGHEVYDSASATNSTNRDISEMLAGLGTLDGDPVETLDLYTRQCALEVTAVDLAVMGATLADGGVNPVTGVRVVSAATCRYTLAVMATAGLYETSGDWLYEVGLPGKSGIGGGIVTVSPGKGGLGTFSPPLDQAGNSVRGTLVARHLATHLGLDLFVSEAARTAPLTSR